MPDTAGRSYKLSRRRRPLTVNTDGSRVVLTGRMSASQDLTLVPPSEAGVVVLVPVLVRGTCMELRHNTFPFLAFNPIKVIDWHN